MDIFSYVFVSITGLTIILTISVITYSLYSAKKIKTVYSTNIMILLALSLIGVVILCLFYIINTVIGYFFASIFAIGEFLNSVCVLI